MNESPLGTVSSACKNVRFSVNIYGSNGLHPALKVLGSQWEEIRVHDDGEVLDFSDVTNPWNECVTLLVSIGFLASYEGSGLIRDQVLLVY